MSRSLRIAWTVAFVAGMLAASIINTWLHYPGCTVVTAVVGFVCGRCTYQVWHL